MVKVYVYLYYCLIIILMKRVKNHFYMVYLVNEMTLTVIIHIKLVMKSQINHFYMVYLVNEMTFNGYNPYSLDLLYIVAILLGILVIISKNPIVSVLFLIGLFLCISVYLILTGLNFIGLSYLLVYIGAVSILFLFILMLINVRISELLIDSINSIPLAILVGSFFNYFVNNVLPYMVITSNLLYQFTIKKQLTNVTSVS
jgi:NADH-ubiquinone oxidoreductase chain 6